MTKIVIIWRMDSEDPVAPQTVSFVYCDSDSGHSASKAQKGGRGMTWPVDDTVKLVKAWADDGVQKKIRSKIHKNKEVYSPIAELFPGRDCDACYKKMQTLIRIYRKYKDEIRGTGGGEVDVPPQIVDVFDVLDSTLHSKDLTDPIIIASIRKFSHPIILVTDCVDELMMSLQDTDGYYVSYSMRGNGV